MPARWTRRLAFFGALAMLGAYPALFEPRWLEVVETQRALPLSQPLRIALLTDLHLPGVGLGPKVAAAIAAARVDLIVVGGDLVDHQGDRAAVTQFLTGLPQVPLGTYVVPGNWEYWALGRTATTTLELGGENWLVNQPRLLRPDLTLIGLDDDLAGHPRVRAALSGTSTKSGAKIALLHSPSGAASLDGRVDLILAGHTHGGQVRLPGIGALILPPGSDGYEAGWYQRGRTPIYVSRGLGMSVLPVRFFCRPELTILDLVPQDNLQKPR